MVIGVPALTTIQQRIQLGSKVMNHWKALALLLAGTLASVIVRILIPDSIPVIFVAFLILLFLALFIFGSGAGSLVLHHYRIWRRKGNRILPPKVGILNDMGWNSDDPEIRACTDVSPNDWKAEITAQAGKRKGKIKIELITTSTNFDSYAAILNPYGSVYPERDMKNFETLSKIAEYVNGGGLFVNVADLPSYWAYSLLLKRRLNTTPPIYDIHELAGGEVYKPVRLFDRNPLMEKLSLRILNTQRTSGFTNWKVKFEKRFNGSSEIADDICVDRVVIVERNVDAVMTPRRNDIENISLTPLFFTNYGDGRFLFSLVWLGKDLPKNYVMKEILSGILVEDIRETRSKRQAK